MIVVKFKTIGSLLLFGGENMKKLMISIVFSLLILMNNTSSAANHPIVFTEDPIAPSEIELIETVIQKYEKNLVRAINDNRFIWIEPYLIPGSNLYHGQKSLIRQLYQRGIKERFISCEIIDCRMTEPDQYKVYVKVSVGVYETRNAESIQEFQWIYRMKKGESGFLLSDIEEWQNDQKYIEQQMLSVKADGYYAKELMRYYGSLLTNAINTLNITQIKAVSNNKAVLESQKRIILKLRKISSEFELSHYEFTATDPTFSCSEISLIFKPVHSTKEVTVNCELKVKEVRKYFSGYAVITGIKEIK